MKANDWADQESVRNLAISELAEVCAAMGISWSATEKQFIIELPTVLLSKPGSYEGMPTKTRKSFDISTWGPVGVDETASPFNHTANPDGSIDLEYKPGLPDDMQFPDYGEILEEGEPPKGDPKAER